MSIAYEAMLFARNVHRDQVRKYTGTPYAEHLAEVAGIVATVLDGADSMQEEMLATAWLHDCIEDQGVTGLQLQRLFGLHIYGGVIGLTDCETGNRAQRKAAARIRLAGQPHWVQTIKCADLISNTASIVKHDPKFATVYLEEKRLLLDVLTKADPRLLRIAREQVGLQ